MAVIIPGIISAFMAEKRENSQRILVASIPFKRKAKSFLTSPCKLPVISQRPDCAPIFKKRKKKSKDLDSPASVIEASKVEGSWGVRSGN